MSCSTRFNAEMPSCEYGAGRACPASKLIRDHNHPTESEYRQLLVLNAVQSRSRGVSARWFRL